MRTACLLLELFSHLGKELRVKMNSKPLPWRANDRKYFVADNRKAERLLRWTPLITKERGIADAVAWECERIS